MCIHIYFHTHSHIYTHTCIHTYTHTYTRMYIHIHTQMHTCTHTHFHTHTHTIPRIEGCFLTAHSVNIHINAAAEVDIWVARRAYAAVSFAANAEPTIVSRIQSIR